MSSKGRYRIGNLIRLINREGINKPKVTFDNVEEKNETLES